MIKLSFFCHRKNLLLLFWFWSRCSFVILCVGLWILMVMVTWTLRYIGHFIWTTALKTSFRVWYHSEDWFKEFIMANDLVAANTPEQKLCWAFKVFVFSPWFLFVFSSCLFKVFVLSPCGCSWHNIGMRCDLIILIIYFLASSAFKIFNAQVWLGQ